MSLCSLKKSRPTAKPALVSVEQFIEDALLYSKGAQAPLAQCWPLQSQNSSIGDEGKDGRPMRRATFTLTESAIAELSELAEQSGISRSHLLRLWIHKHYVQSSN